MSAFGSLLRHPLVIFSLGVATGVAAYKYRKEIMAAVAKSSDLGRDFILQQKESLEDLLEEAREAEEGAVKSENGAT